MLLQSLNNRARVLDRGGMELETFAAADPDPTASTRPSARDAAASAFGGRRLDADRSAGSVGAV